MSSKKTSRFIINVGLVLIILNMWLWNPQLPFANYALNNSKIMLIQVVHVILNTATTIVLLKLGQSFIKQKPDLPKLVNSWLLVVGAGLLETLIFLLWKKQFQFSDLLNALFPLTRNVVPVIMAILLGRNLIPFLGKLTASSRHQIGGMLLLGLLASFLFNNDLWGFATTYNLPLTILLMVLGGCLHDYQLSLNHPKISIGGVLLLNVILAAVMPKISVAYNNDFSTVARFANPSSFLTVLTAVGLMILVKDKVTVTGYYPVFLALLFATYPVFANQLIASLNGHFNRGVIRYPVMVVVAAIILPLAFVVTDLLRKLTLTAWYHRYVDRLNMLNDPDDRKQLLTDFWQANRANLIAFIGIYLLSAVSLLAMDNSLKITPNVDQTYNVFIYTICNRQSLILLTTVFIWLMFKFFQALTNRFWWGIGITFTLNLIWIIANRIKIGARNEPILPSEMVMYQAYSSLIKMVNPFLIIATLVCLVLIGWGIVYLTRRHDVTKLSAWRRVIYIILTVLVYSSCFWWNHEGTAVQTFMTGMNDQPMPYNQLSGARLNGPLIQFMNNVDVRVMDKPNGYSKATMQKIAKRYQQSAMTINGSRTNDLSKQTVILNLSESYANPERVPGVKLSNDPTPFIKSLSKKTTSGLMISSGYGGGTANMEYMSLTGLVLANFSPTLVTPFTQLVPFNGHQWSINQMFKHSAVIHPYVGTFYSRQTVYQKFGFDQFMHLGSQYPIRHQKKIDRSPYLSDYTSYENAVDQLNANVQPQFISLVTMQNHFPYTEHFYNGANKYQATIKGAATDPDTVAQYAMGIHHTDEAVQQFIRQVDRMSQPVTVVFYGDHLPGIYQNEMAKDGLKLHETDYFIYSNPAARKQGAKQFIDHNRVVGPNDFIAMIAQQTNSKVTPYIALLTQVHEGLPTVALKTNSASANEYHSSPQFINDHGKIVSPKRFTKEQQRLWKDYVMVQYDMTSGNHYLNQQNFFKMASLRKTK